MHIKKSIMHVAECAVGVERYLSLFLPSLNGEFDNIFVMSQNYDIEKWKGLVPYVELVEMNNNLSLKNDFISVLKLRKIIKKHKPDIIYLHSSKAGGIGRIANLGLCKNVIYNPHGWGFKMKNSRLSFAYLIIESILSFVTTKIIAISDFEKEIAIEKNVCGDEKIVVIKNGIDVSDYQNSNPISRKDLNIPDNAFLVGAVARLTYGKSPDFFVKVASKLIQEIPESYFIIVSDGELKNETLLLAKEYGIEKRLIITGWVSDVRQYVKLFDVGVLFTRWEGFGYALAEYMLESIPVIGTNVDSIPELIVDGKNGYLIELENQNEAVEKLKLIYQKSQLGNELGIYGNKFVKFNFNSTRVVDEHRELFNDMLFPEGTPVLRNKIPGYSATKYASDGV